MLFHTKIWCILIDKGMKKKEVNINEFGRFDELKNTVDKVKAFFKRKEQSKFNPPKVNIRTDKLLRKFILSDGFDIEQL